MQKKQFHFLALLFAVGILFPNCFKESPQGPTYQDPCPYPEITSQGLNTFGCKIDGVEWVPCVDLFGRVVGLRPFSCRVTEIPDSNIFGLNVLRSVKDSTYAIPGSSFGFGFRVEPLNIGKFEIPNGFFFNDFGFIDEYPKDATFGLIDTTAQNFLEITRLDLDSNIVSGIFQITLINEDTNEKVHITDGRFDFTYFPQ